LLLVAGVLGAAHSDWYRARDFYALYVGARKTATGADPYDEVAWCLATDGAAVGDLRPNGTPVCVTRYAYPKWTALAMVPLGVLPLPAAASIWLALSVGAAVLGARWSWLAFRGSRRSAIVFAVLVFGSQPFWLMVGGGQISGMLFGGAGLASYLLATGRDRRAGLSLAILAAKPNVLGLAALALLARAVVVRAPALLAGALIAGLVLFALTLPFDPLWPAKLVREIVGRQTAHNVELATAWGLAAHDLGASLAAPFLIALVTAVAVWLARGIPRDAAVFNALAIPLGLFATPYAWSYDFVPLAVTWALVIARAERATAGARRGVLLALVLGASLLPWLLYGLAFQRGTETLSALVPAFTALVAAAALRVRPGR
jgi:hypothetical protein